MCLRAINKLDGSIVPCGKCPLCIARRISGWSFRLMQELKHSSSAHFITLTYDDKHAPTDLFGNLTISKRDLRNFFKRLRKANSKKPSVLLSTEENTGGLVTRVSRIVHNKPIKYFAVGEYGSRTYRPHYHIILFNASVELIQNAWGITDRLTLETEHIGQVHYGDQRGVCEASIGYCFKYLQKQNRRYWKGELRQPTFSVCSKGLGIEYLTEQTCEWHAADVENRMYIQLQDGKKISMPRYYKDKIFFDGERSAAAKKMIDKLMYDASKIKDHRKHYRETKANIEAAFDHMYQKHFENSKL